MPFNQSGIFKATPIAWGIRESDKSNSVAISIEWIPEEVFDEDRKEFIKFENPDGLTVAGDIWIVGKEGNYIKQNIQQTMVDTLGWSGDFKDFEEDGTFKPPRCQITVEWDTYRGGSYKVLWVNPLGGGSGHIAKVSSSALANLSDKFGDSFKQIIKGEEPTPF